LLRIVAFFLFKEAYFYVGWLLVTSRCASRGKLGLAERCLRILIELQEQETGAALVTTEAILRCLDEGDIRRPRLLHGDADAIVWPMLDVALHRGYDTRIGLEDTLTLPDGQLAKDNAELVAHAVRKAQQIGAM
jgi:uncharacterized protein (DUF849 family)